MDLLLTGRRAVVTGASRGIGLAAGAGSSTSRAWRPGQTGSVVGSVRNAAVVSM